MSWRDCHQRSEEMASAAEAAERNGDIFRSRSLYAQAAEAEHDALNELQGDKPRTLGITAVSWVALLLKSGQCGRAASAAVEVFVRFKVPRGAKEQIAGICTEAQASLRFADQLTAAQGERLAFLGEECSEVGKALGKISRHGLESRFPPVSGKSNREKLEAELGDVLFAMRLLESAGDIDMDTVSAQAEAKWRDPPVRWFHHQDWGALQTAAHAKRRDGGRA